MTNRSIEVEATLRLALEALESAEPKYTKQRADQKTLGGSLDYWKLAQHQRLKAITTIKAALEAHKALAVDKESLTTEAQQSVTCVSNEQVEPKAWISWNRVSGESKLNYHKVVSHHDANLWQHFPLYTHPPVPYVVEPRTAQPAVSETHKQKPVSFDDADIYEFWARNKESEKLEPVAYRSRIRNRDGQVITGWVVHLEKTENPDPRYEIEPLYTTPPTQQSCLQRPSRSDIKPLTDEQADDIALEVMGFAVLDKEQAETARMLIRNTEAAHGICPTDFKE